MARIRWKLAAAVWMLVSVANMGAVHAGGIGVIGDSYSDEYQFYSPDRSTARNWVEQLATLRGLDFGPFSTATRGEPRGPGYAYNWARSWATTDDMIAQGQHTGVAAQVARGEVGLVVVFIGGNDFINALNSADPPSALRATTPRAISNLRTAVATVRAASPEVKLLLATVPDIRSLPEFREPLRTGRLPAAWADATTAAIRKFNAEVKALAADHPRTAVIDLFLQTKVIDLVAADSLTVAGRKMTRVTAGNDSEHLFLADLRHTGTVGQGILARSIVQTLNARFDAGIAPLDDREIVAFAESLAVKPEAVARARTDAPKDIAVETVSDVNR